ncbi:hypothetical protein HYX17_03555 [Candidatus Woesearchaeota archaeon]|nr:hypothetical protein [Candidatus Woesearchaeota archaeon]
MVYSEMGFLSLKGGEIPSPRSKEKEKEELHIGQLLNRGLFIIDSIYPHLGTFFKFHDSKDLPSAFGLYQIYGENRELMVGLTLVDGKYLLSITTPYRELVDDLGGLLEEMSSKIEFSIKSRPEYPENETLDAMLERTFEPILNSR